MRSRFHHLSHLAPLLCLLAFAAPLGGCEDEAPSGGPAANNANNDANNTSTNNTTNDADCRTSAECDATEAGAGQLCDDGACVACTSDEACSADATYGVSRPRCDEGRCVGCAPGTVGCACDDAGGCALGECLDDACVDCERGDEGCLCRLNGTCGAGFRCEDERCVACTPGLEGCPCGDGDACGEGLVCSDADVCIPDPCVAGAEGCPCGDDGACNAALYCDDTSRCQRCTSDIPGCPCDLDDTCEGDNYCADGACAACPDADRPETCGCEETADCAEGLACDADDLLCRLPLLCVDLCLDHQLCDASLPGDPVCIPETCEEGYIWDGSACVASLRESCDGRTGTIDLTPTCEAEGKACVETVTGALCVITCDALQTACADANRDCSPNDASEDATCGACRPGYTDQGGACVLNPQANCVPDALDSILELCTARLQECLTLTDGATCGPCLSGTEPNASLNACVPSALCGDTICSDAEFCDYPQTGGPPRCAPRLCPDTQAWDEEQGACVTCAAPCDGAGYWPETVDGACACASAVFCDYQYNGSGQRCHATTCPSGQAATPGGECIDCALACGDTEGESPRLWPLTTAEGSCICETLPGYYYPLGGANTPKRCDEDQDGWLNRTAFETFSISEPATLANFRCELRVIDRFILRNEYGQEHRVSLCDGELVSYPDQSEPPCGQDATTFALYEPDLLDHDRRIAVDDTQFPAYGAAGRKLRATELNPLTRACVSLTADFNLNGREDVAEDQPIARDRIDGLTFANDADFVFQSMAYFTELHRGSFRPALSAGRAGAYVIEERSRCAADFPLDYLSGGEYWRGCTRNRWLAFDSDRASLAGLDFAAWSCDPSSGTCPLPDAPTNAPSSDRDNDRVPDHDLCNLTRDLSGAPWRGMNHHSQFQCVVLKNAASQLWEVDRGRLYNGPGENTSFAFNACQASACASDDPTCVESTRPAPLQPSTPTLSCTPTLRAQTQLDQVGFVALRYIADGAGSNVRPVYTRGCMDESFWEGSDGGYTTLCPGYEENPGGVLASGNPGDFGKLICSCGTFYGGANCEYACPERSQASGTPTTALHTGAPDLGYDDATKALYSCDPDFGYCQLHPPDPDADFEGGRRGWWSCGELTSTRPVTGTDPVLRSEDPNAGWSLEGKVRLVPVRRTPLTEASCDPAQSNCWSIF